MYAPRSIRTLLRWFAAVALIALVALAPPAWASSIDINSAGVAELDTLPGIGPAKAQAIVQFRTDNGAFQAIEEIQRVPGIGPATFANISGMISVAGGGAAAPAPAQTGDAPPPAPAAAPAPVAPPVTTGAVNINTADAAALETLPGVGPSKAAAILDDRGRNGPFASCADLQRVAGIGPATVANMGAACTTQ